MEHSDLYFDRIGLEAVELLAPLPSEPMDGILISHQHRQPDESALVYGCCGLFEMA